MWLFVPETKSIPLEAMDRLFAIKPTHRANEILMNELRLEDDEFRRAAGVESLPVGEDEKFKLGQVESDQSV